MPLILNSVLTWFKLFTHLSYFSKGALLSEYFVPSQKFQSIADQDTAYHIYDRNGQANKNIQPALQPGFDFV